MADGGGGWEGRTREDSRILEFRRSPGRSKRSILSHIIHADHDWKTYVSWSRPAIDACPHRPLQVPPYQLHRAWTGPALGVFVSRFLLRY